jgi:hypothetical protein
MNGRCRRPTMVVRVRDSTVRERKNLHTAEPTLVNSRMPQANPLNSAFYEQFLGSRNCGELAVWQAKCTLGSTPERLPKETRQLFALIASGHAE